jgi:hypothetical protein
MNKQIMDALDAIMRGDMPEGYVKEELPGGMGYVFKRIEEPREFTPNPENYRQTTHDLLNSISARGPFGRAAGVHAFEDFGQAIRKGLDAGSVNAQMRAAQEQHDKVLRDTNYERVLKQATFMLGNAMMCGSENHVLKTLRLVLNEAGEAAAEDNERDFDKSMEVFNGMLDLLNVERIQFSKD